MPENTPPKNISWSKVIITVLVIVLVAGLISGFLFWYFLVRQPTESTPATTNVATSSAKTSTSSAKPDEIAGWKTYTNKYNDKYFTFNYPDGWKVSVEVVDKQLNNINYLVEKGSYQIRFLNNRAFSGVADGPPEVVQKYDFTIIQVKFDGKTMSANQATAKDGSLWEVTPQISTYEDKDFPFVFGLNSTKVPNATDKESILLIVSTFKFL